MGTNPSRFLSTPMREARQWLTIEPTLVDADATLYEVAQLGIRNPGARTISVIDEIGRLIGVIPVPVLIEHFLFEFAAPVVPRTSPTILLGRKLLHHSEARQAKDIMQPPVSVRVNATVEDAIRAMKSAGLGGLPITDVGNRVIGYADQFELLTAPIRADI